VRARPSILIVPVLVSVALLTAACSTSDDDDAGAGSPASTSTSAEPVELAAAVDAAGTVTHGSITVDGRERTYRMYVPSQLPEGPVPLVLAFHGGFGWGDQFATTNHVEGLAESNGFVVVHPDGVKIPGQPGGVWNGGICCGIAAREQVDDVGFVDALIDEVDEVEAGHDIDPARVYALGHSNGGIMSYRLACELSDRVVAVGVVAGTLAVDGCDPSQPVSVIHVHGDADDSLPIDGGVGRDSLAGVAFPPPHDGFDTLAAADGCPGSAAAEPDPGNPDLTVERRQPCDAGSTAEFVTIAGGPHAWPGGTPRVEPRTGAGYPGYDATAEIVTFLLSHPRPRG
jgi:polyhydroxybutyrate depolymerase